MANQEEFSKAMMLYEEWGIGPRRQPKYSRPTVIWCLQLWKAKIWVTTLIAGNVAWIWPSTASILKSLLSYQGSECFRNISKTSEPMIKIVCFLTPASLGKVLQPHLWGCRIKAKLLPTFASKKCPSMKSPFVRFQSLKNEISALTPAPVCEIVIR